MLNDLWIYGRKLQTEVRVAEGFWAKVSRNMSVADDDDDDDYDDDDDNYDNDVLMTVMMTIHNDLTMIYDG